MSGALRYTGFLMALAAAFSLLIPSGCGDSPVMQTLLRAESVVEEDPDSTLSLVTSIPEKELGNDEERALWALLRTQSETKTGIDITDDSLISTAVSYYTGRDDSGRLMKAVYYSAFVDYNSGDYARSSVKALKAQQMAAELGDPYWEAKATDLLGDIYSATYLWDESAEAFRKTAGLYRKAGKPRNGDFALADYAGVIGDQGKSERSLQILDSLLGKYSKGTTDTMFCRRALEKAFSISVISAGAERSRRYFETLRSLKNSMQRSSDDLADMSLLASLEGDYPNASRLLERAIGLADNIQDSLNVANAAIFLYKSNGDVSSLSRELQTAIQLQNNAISAVMNQSVAIAQRDYLSMESRLYEERSQKSRLILIFIIITFIIIAASAITLLLYWIRLKNKESEVQFARISGLMKEIDGLKEREDGDDGFLKETWNLVGKMYEELMESIDMGDKMYQVREKIDLFLHGVASKGTMQKLEKAIDKEYNGVISRLRSQVEGIPETDVMLFMFELLGFSPRSISVLLNSTQKNFYNRRSRLRTRIEKSGAPDAKSFLRTLEK